MVFPKLIYSRENKCSFDVVDDTQNKNNINYNSQISPRKPLRLISCLHTYYNFFLPVAIAKAFWKLPKSSGYCQCPLKIAKTLCKLPKASRNCQIPLDTAKNLSTLEIVKAPVKLTNPLDLFKLPIPSENCQRHLQISKVFREITKVLLKLPKLYEKLPKASGNCKSPLEHAKVLWKLPKPFGNCQCPLD